MSYKVLSLKWRPQTFEDIVGQDHVTKTLINAFKLERVAQGYMFTGPRGVGKTTTARILSRALNADGGPRYDFDPSTNLSLEIAEGRALDVLEIDGASNRGIEEIRNLQNQDKKILFEGAQGALLDISLGTYPFVTSSNLIGGITSGAGVSPSDIDYTIGITKAYTTRVGEGPFPTELFDEVGTYLAETGGEVGATTGRPRRCGWLDGLLLENMTRLSGVNGLCLTKIDVLDGLEKVKICTSYKSSKSSEELIETMDIEDVQPQYLELEGWSEPTAGITQFDDLNANAKAFVEKVEEISGVPVIMISTGPKREDTIIRQQI